MIIKQDMKQLSFLFQEEDAYFELGYMILEQEHFVQMLPYKRGEARGREKLLFQVKKYKALSEVLPSLSEQEVLELIYTLFAMTARVEVSGLLTRECIWCQYEQLYYDTATGGLKLALLPIAEEVSIDVAWSANFLRTVKLMIGIFSEDKQQQLLVLTQELLEKKKECSQILQEVNDLGTGVSAPLVYQAEVEKDRQLELYYSGREGTIQLLMKSDTLKIGKSQEEADGVIDISQAVSRLHCMIIKQNQKFFVQDLNSVNHTFVNGEYIPPYEFMELQDHDILAVADVELRVHIS